MATNNADNNAQRNARSKVDNNFDNNVDNNVDRKIGAASAARYLSGSDIDIADRFFLPDLCRSQTVIYLIVIGEGLVAALLLFDHGYSSLTWQKFGLASLYIQWIILSSLFLLCRLRNRLLHFSARLAGLIATLITLAVTCLITLISQWLQPLIYPTLDYAELLARASAAIILTIIYLRYCFVQSRWRNQIELASQAEIKALQAIIRPHFFFNSMNAVAELLHSDAAKAEKVLIDLSKLFRAVLQQQESPFIPMSKELELIQSYLAIEKVRFAERLTIIWQIPEHLPNIRIPTLLLQPLIENAIKHGISPAPEPGELTIQLAYQDSASVLGQLVQPQQGGNLPYWQFKIGNTCHPDYPSSPGNGLALRNIQQRLQVHYGNRAYLTTHASPTYYTVIVKLPIDSG